MSAAEPSKKKARAAEEEEPAYNSGFNNEFATEALPVFFDFFLRLYWFSFALGYSHVCSLSTNFKGGSSCGSK
jgi:hypothetical protein